MQRPGRAKLTLGGRGGTRAWRCERGRCFGRRAVLGASCWGRAVLGVLGGTREHEGGDALERVPHRRHEHGGDDERGQRDGRVEEDNVLGRSVRLPALSRRKRGRHLALAPGLAVGRGGGGRGGLRG